MYLIKLVKSTVLNVLNYLKVEQYTTKEMKCKGDYALTTNFYSKYLVVLVCYRDFGTINTKRVSNWKILRVIRRYLCIYLRKKVKNPSHFE